MQRNHILKTVFAYKARITYLQRPTGSEIDDLTSIVMLGTELRG